MRDHSPAPSSDLSLSATLGAAYLATGLAMSVFIMLVVEPAMGFTGVADYMNPDKIASNAGATAWLLVDLFYLTLFVAVAAIARESSDPVLLWSGLAGSIMFFLVGSLDRVTDALPELITQADTRRVALIAMLAVRLAVLKAAVMGIALFAWRSTREAPAPGLAHRAWSGLGYATLAAGVLFLFSFFPAPVVFFVWAVALTWRKVGELRRSRALVPGPAGLGR